MFSELITLVEDNGKGIHAFRKGTALARRRAVENPDLTAAWGLLARMSDLFVERNEREPLMTKQCEQWFALLKSEAGRLEQAFSDSDPAGRLDALNQTSRILVEQEA